MILRGEVYLIDLEPSRGSEIRKVRPCVVVSPDERNTIAATVIVAPMTTGSHAYRVRVPVAFQGKRGHIVLDQIRTVARERLIRKVGDVSPTTLKRCLVVLQEMFAF